jgi:tetratricopeptide (TPR) repeat protein
MKRVLIVILAAACLLPACTRDTTGEYKPSKRALELNNRAVRALADKNVEQALAFVNDAIKLEPKFHKAYANKAAVLEAMGRSDEAATTLSEAITIRPDFADAYIPLGLMREKAGNTQEADALYKKALELYNAELQMQPKLAAAARNKAVTLFLLKERNEALSTLRKVLEDNPKDEAALAIMNRIENGGREAFIGLDKTPAPASAKP